MKVITGTALILFLVSTLTIAFNLLPVFAQIQVTTWIEPFTVVPKSVSIGQSVVATAYVRPPPSKYYLFYNGLQFRITKPDGSVVNSKSLTSDMNGTIVFNYVPDQIGTYFFQLYYPGEQINENIIFTSCESTTITLIVIEPPPVGDVTNPVAYAWTRDHMPEERTTVTFNGTGSSDNVGIVSYEWDFGDGTIGTGVTVTHTYTTEGTYIVTLTVKDAAGNWDRDTLNMIVGKASTQKGVTPFPSWILTPIIVGITGVTAILVYLKPTQLLPQALKNLDKIITKLGEKNYEDILKNFDSTNKLIRDAISKGKLPGEISGKPYFITQNLDRIKKNLFEAFKNGTVDNLLKVSEIIPYIEGIRCVLKALKNIDEWEELMHEEESSARDCIAYISSNPVAHAFEKVHIASKRIKKDFWFIWPEEFEPIKLVFEKEKVASVLYRYHWKHFTIDKPYLDGKNRIEVFFLPHFHTPIIRRIKEDVLFAIFVKCYAARMKDYTVVDDEVIPEYYVSKGEKDRHPPSVDYEGWPD
jgi:PKD repeat protein